MLFRERRRVSRLCRCFSSADFVFLVNRPFPGWRGEPCVRIYHFTGELDRVRVVVNSLLDIWGYVARASCFMDRFIFLSSSSDVSLDTDYIYHAVVVNSIDLGFYKLALVPETTVRFNLAGSRLILATLAERIAGPSRCYRR